MLIALARSPSAISRSLAAPAGLTSAPRTSSICCTPSLCRVPGGTAPPLLGVRGASAVGGTRAVPLPPEPAAEPSFPAPCGPGAPSAAGPSPCPSPEASLATGPPPSGLGVSGGASRTLRSSPFGPAVASSPTGPSSRLGPFALPSSARPSSLLGPGGASSSLGPSSRFAADGSSTSSSSPFGSGSACEAPSCPPACSASGSESGRGGGLLMLLRNSALEDCESTRFRK
mmetsp:Transcript_36646/g.87038  ORF Transcript_36646/g.87038 Transcript_36646/m.87038 type:complete len:229 (+) Transcript_36646:2829-3515(+)